MGHIDGGDFVVFVRKLRSSFLVSSLSLASRLLRGSSNRMTLGSGTRALARATRCCCPPLNFVAGDFRTPQAATNCNVFSTLLLISSFGAFFT